MTWSRVGGAAAAAGGAAWLIVFGAGTLGIRVTWLEDLIWILPLAFGLGTIGLYEGGSSRLDRLAVYVAGAVAVLATAAYGAGVLLFGGESTIGYITWLVFILGILALLALVLAYGARHRRDARDRGVARAALVLSGVPFAFLVLILAYKVATGWWVTDPGLVAFGSIGAALLVGGGWLLLGLAIWMRDPQTAG